MIRNAFSVRKKLRMLVYGEPFTGKSTIAMQFAYLKRTDGEDFRVLYLDTEGGSVDNYVDDLLENGVKPDNFQIVYTQSLNEVQDYIKKVTNDEDILDDDGDVIMDAYGKPFRADAIVVDSATILNLTTKEGLSAFSKRRAKVKADAQGLVGDAKAVKVEGAGMELKDYQTLNFKGQSMILDLNASGVNYIVTCREKDETVNKEVNGIVSGVATGRKIPDGFKGQDYNVDTEFRLYRNPDDKSIVMAYFDKDRTGLHKDCEVVENLSLLEYQEVLDRSSKNKKVIIKNGLNDAVKTEMELTMRDLGIEDEEQQAKKESDEEAEASTGPTVDTLRNKARQMISSCTSPVKKAAMQKAVKDAGLPTALAKITDAEVMAKVVAVMEEASA